MYSAMSSPAAWNTGNARSTSAGQLLRRALGLDVDAEHGRQDAPAELADTVAGRGGSLGEGFCAPHRVVGPACPGQGFAELDLEGQVELGRRDEGGGALEQADGGAVVLAEGRAVAARHQVSPRRGRRDAVVGIPSSAR